MNIHEYQAKQLLREAGVPTLKGYPAFSVMEAREAAETLGGDTWIVKAQIHAGGRGKAGGVVVCQSLEAVEAAAQKLFNACLVTPQTGPEGQIVRRLYIEEGCQIDREFYLSFVIDRVYACTTIIASPAGGMDIEAVAQSTPEQVLHLPIDPATGLQDFHGRRVAFFLGLSGKHIQACTQLLHNVYQAFTAHDAELIEINPLVLSRSGELYALDAKISFDDSALFRHPDLEMLRDPGEETAIEIDARNHDLSYVKLNGNIGCMVNGAGLAMATMDIIKLHGGEPANFLDVGGGANQEKVTAAFKMILADPQVRAILINIFGGIMRCDVLAEGIVAAAREVQLHVPMVVRLQGTNVALGREILAASQLPIISEDALSIAAQKVVEAAKGAS